MSAPNTGIINLIGFAAALLLGFRTNSAYERWYEGRKLFEVACARVREIVRYWTIYFPATTDEDKGLQLDACRAAVAYVYALMYHLRDEDPLDHPDCSDLIPRTKNGNLAIESDNPNTPRYYFEQAHRVVQMSGINRTAGTVEIKKNLTSFRLPGTWRNPQTYAVPSQLMGLMYKYTKEKAGIAQTGLFTDLGYTQMSLERILSTPMPPVYSIHLKMVLTIYFASIPFQFLQWSYFGILLMAVTAFVMWGFESMGLELENPFGYDANDLPLTEICAMLRREIDFLFENPVSDLADWEAKATRTTDEQLEAEMAAENGLTAEDMARLDKRMAGIDAEDEKRMKAQ
ncbi:Bestrophin, RFP-TM, chloride channel-domain-containing protein [Hyaloraphidium curvatum]|nr:Bestrophin, RFP-TM, chloride channel-domain-containing protein [Hyaloraphidium curvatum]KAI9021356.1 Bestrophin, RFP-TM, chloride channel-domain-containing protein [Hyaloraphidium curvatum]